MKLNQLLQRFRLIPAKQEKSGFRVVRQARGQISRNSNEYLFSLLHVIPVLNLREKLIAKICLANQFKPYYQKAAGYVLMLEAWTPIKFGW